MIIEQTIKEKVIKIARNNPFLTVKNIATQCNTTPRYVRTTLSENQVSLTKLRKDHFFDLKKRYKELKKEHEQLKEIISIL